MKTNPDGVFFPTVVTTELTGERVTLPVFSLVREQQVRDLMIEAFNGMDEATQATMTKNFLSPDTLMRFFIKNPTVWVQIASIQFDRSVEWVRKSLTFAEIFRETLVVLLPRKGTVVKERSPQAQTWTLARSLEFLMQEYGWTADEATAHSRAQIESLIEACTARYHEQNPDAKKAGRSSRYEGHPKAQGSVAPATSADLGDDGGMSSVRAFAQRNNAVIKKG